MMVCAGGDAWNPSPHPARRAARPCSYTNIASLLPRVISDLMARKLAAEAPGWVHHIPTDDRAVADVAAQIVGLTRWAATGGE